MKCLYVFIFLVFTSLQAHAGAYVYPVSIKYTSPNALVVQKIIAWTENNAPNPCYGASQCWLGLDVLYTYLGTPDLGGTCRAGNCLEISRYATKKDVLKAFIKKFGVPYQSSPFPIDNVNATCVGLFYIKGAPHDGFGSGVKWPESTCGKLPPYRQTCDISLPSAIDYGNLTAQTLEGKEMTITGDIKCAQNGTVKLYGMSRSGAGKVFLNKNKTLYSELNINNSRAVDGVSVNVVGNRTPVSFSLTSILKITGEIEANAYEGSGIVLLTYP